jgi:hypothetical protein
MQPGLELFLELTIMPITIVNTIMFMSITTIRSHRCISPVGSGLGFLSIKSNTVGILIGCQVIGNFMNIKGDKNE